MGNPARQKPRTYSEACEALGGGPWRALEGTESWFLLDESELAGDAQDEPEPLAATAAVDEEELDTAAFRIRSDSLFSRAPTWLALGGMLIAITLAVTLLPNAVAPPVLAAAVPVATTPVAPAPPRPVPAPPVAAPTVSAVASVSAKKVTPRKRWRRRVRR